MGATTAKMSTMETDKGDGALPVAGKGAPPEGWLSMTAAVAHTGIPPMTLRRRVDAWIRGDGARILNGYAIKSARVYGGRLVDAVDAERARLQHQVLLDPAVNAAQWEARVRDGELPGDVTGEAWWPEAVARLRGRPPAPPE